MRPSEIHCKEQMMKSYLSKKAILYVKTFSSLKQHMSTIWKTTDPRSERGSSSRQEGRKQEAAAAWSALGSLQVAVSRSTGP